MRIARDLTAVGGMAAVFWALWGIDHRLAVGLAGGMVAGLAVWSRLVEARK